MAKIALLIGVSEYSDSGLNSLPAATNDVQALQAVLQWLGDFNEVFPLLNPNKTQMEEAIEKAFSDRRRDDLLMFYFSGHGVKDDNGRLFFATRNTRKLTLRSTAVPASFVHEVMGESRSRQQIVILDCCYSGAFAEGMRTKDDQSVNIQGQLRGEGRAVLTSSTAHEYSLEQQGQGLSVYTHHLVDGIWNGTADLDRDGWISIQELHEYTKSKVREVSSAMKPEIYMDREAYKIYLCRAPQVDPELLYFKEVEDSLRRGEIYFFSRNWVDTVRYWLSMPARPDYVVSSVGQATLSAVQSKVGLTAESAAAIQERVLQPYRERHKHKQQYREAFAKEFRRRKSITPLQRQGLKRLQHISGLADTEVSAIEEEFTQEPKWLSNSGVKNLFSTGNIQIVLWATIFVVSGLIVISVIQIFQSSKESSLEIPSPSPEISIPPTPGVTSSPSRFFNSETEILFSQGEEKFSKKDFKGAILNFEQVVQRDPQNIKAYLWLGEAYFRLDKFKETIAICEQLINEDADLENLSSDNLIYLYDLKGRSYYQWGKSKNSLDLSLFKHAQGSFQEAIILMESKSLATFENQQKLYKLYFQKGEIELSLDNTKDAIEAFSKAIEINSRDSKSFERRGDAWKTLNQFTNAKKDYVRASEILQEKGNQKESERVKRKITQLQKPRR
ncbi:caspase, EACC1-associated type [Leptothermofonsia sp. ETS-13]|uniref:caspase, EACC1-associated type n=1 Tax=Leptothermofonsia sp. ETS-13 TaxID=3035696 RepID=UPI003BA0C0D2